MDNLIIMTAKIERDYKFIQLVCKCRKMFLQIMVERQFDRDGKNTLQQT